MEKFYQMQIEEGGIVGPEGPGDCLCALSSVLEPNRA